MVVAYDEACLRGHGVPQLIDILIREVLHSQPTSPSAVVETLLHSLTRKNTISEYYSAVERKHTRLMEVVDACPHYGMFQGNEVFYFARPRLDGSMHEMFPGGAEIRVTPSTYSNFIALRNHFDTALDSSKVTSHHSSSTSQSVDAFRGLPPLELLPLSPRLHLVSGTYTPILKLIEMIVSIASMAPSGPNSTKTSAASKLQRVWDDFNLVYAVPYHSVQHDLIPNGSCTKVPYAEASKFIQLANDKLSELDYEVKKRSLNAQQHSSFSNNNAPQGGHAPKSPIPTPPQGNSSLHRFSARRQPSDAHTTLQRTASARLRAVGISSPDGDLPATFIEGTPVTTYSTDTSTWNTNVELDTKSISNEYLQLIKGFLDEALEVADFLEIGVTYCIPLGEGTKYDLLPEGRTIKVPFSERREYVRRVFLEKRRIDSEIVRDLIKHGAVTVASSSMSPGEGSLRGSIMMRSPNNNNNTSHNINVRGSNSLSFSQGFQRITNPVTSKSPSFIQGNHFSHSRSISSIPLSTIQIDALRGFQSHLEALRDMTVLTQSQWDSFRMAYCIKLPGGVSFDLLPDGRKVPVELVDKDTFIQLAENKAITILTEQEERRVLREKAASSPRRLLYHSSEGSPVSPSSLAESVEKDREMFSPRDILNFDDGPVNEDDNDASFNVVPIQPIQGTTMYKMAAIDESGVAASNEMFSRGSSDNNSPKHVTAGMSSSGIGSGGGLDGVRQSNSLVKRSSGSSIPAAAARAFAASKAMDGSTSSRKSSVQVQQPAAGGGSGTLGGGASWILQQSLNASQTKAAVVPEQLGAGVLDGSESSSCRTAAPHGGVSNPASTLSHTRRPTSSLDATATLDLTGIPQEMMSNTPIPGRETAVPTTDEYNPGNEL